MLWLLEDAQLSAEFYCADLAVFARPTVQGRGWRSEMQVKYAPDGHLARTGSRGLVVRARSLHARGL